MTPQSWTSLKLRALDLAELSDAWRLAPRAFVFFYLYQLERITTWFMVMPDPQTAQATFTGAVWGFLVPVLGWYMSTGRRWTT